MLKVLMFIGLFASGIGLSYLIYGREGLGLRQQEGKNNFLLALLLGLVMLFWGMCLLFWVSGIARGDKALCIAVTIGVPVILLIVGIVTRIKVRKAIAEQDSLFLDPSQ